MDKDRLGDQLRKEASDGRRAQFAYEGFIRPFIEHKRQVLFEAFHAVSVEHPEQLMEIKRQLMAIEALDHEIKVYIETGQLAEHQLNDEEIH
jgi:hypothetical protein